MQMAQLLFKINWQFLIKLNKITYQIIQQLFSNSNPCLSGIREDYKVVAHCWSDGTVLYSDCGWVPQIYTNTEWHIFVLQKSQFYYILI